VAGSKKGYEMRNAQPLGLEELMIVNPSPAALGSSFMGEDGTLYQVQGLAQEEERGGLGQFFLGEDRTLYQLQETDPGGSTELAGFDEALGEDAYRELGRFLLGEDGTLYEVMR